MTTPVVTRKNKFRAYLTISKGDENQLAPKANRR